MWGVAAVLGALGGARPTGLAVLDVALLAAGGLVMAMCASEARSIPLYAACAAAAVCQEEAAPLALGVAGMAAVLLRRYPWGGNAAAAAAGGLAWAAAVGAPMRPGAQPLAAPMLASAWLLLSARLHGSRRFRKRFDGVALGVGGLAAATACLAAVSVLGARNHLERGADLLEAGLVAARDGDTDGALADLRAARRVLQQGDNSLGAVWARPSWLLPGVSQNLRALHHGVDEVLDLADAAIAAAIEADVESLRARGGRVDLAAFEAMEAPLAQVVTRLEAADETVADITDQWLLPYVRERIDELHQEIRNGLPSARLALDAVRTAPAMLGGDTPRTYLVLFTTPVEARATTGFPGNYAEVTFTDGRFEMTRFGRGTDLNDALSGSTATLSGLDEYRSRYDRFGPTREWRNIPMSPDFPTVAEVVRQWYPQAGGNAVDGVMSIDPAGLASLLQLTGGIDVSGVDGRLTAENAAAFLQLDQYVELPDIPNRVDVLEQLARLTMERLTSVDLPGPRELGDLLGPVIEEHHLQLYAFDPSEADLVDGMGISGRYPEVRGDFVGVTTTNAGGNKIDVFLQRALSYDAHWDPDTGEVTATATVTLANESPPSGLPDYVIGNALGRRLGDPDLPRGSNSSFVTLYTPWEPAGATLDGQPVDLETGEELGRRALSTFVAIPPGGTVTLVVELRGVLEDEDTYRLDLAPQPLVHAEQADVHITVAGRGSLRSTGPVEARGRTYDGAFTLVRNTVIEVSRK